LTRWYAFQLFVVGVAHLETESRGPDCSRDRDAIALFQLVRDPGLVEPDEIQVVVVVVLQRRLRHLQLLEPADLGRDLDDRARDGRQRAGSQLRNRLWVAELVPCEWQVQEQIADRADSERGETLQIQRLDLGKLLDRRVERQPRIQNDHAVKIAKLKLGLRYIAGS